MLVHHSYRLCELTHTTFPVSVESAGQYPAVDLFPVAVSIMRGKVRNLKADVERLRREWLGRREDDVGEGEKDVEMAGS